MSYTVKSLTEEPKVQMRSFIYMFIGTEYCKNCIVKHISIISVIMFYEEFFYPWLCRIVVVSTRWNKGSSSVEKVVTKFHCLSG